MSGIIDLLGMRFDALQTMSGRSSLNGSSVYICGKHTVCVLSDSITFFDFDACVCVCGVCMISSNDTCNMSNACYSNEIPFVSSIVRHD